jgi:hypothetical protein
MGWILQKCRLSKWEGYGYIANIWFALGMTLMLGLISLGNGIWLGGVLLGLGFLLAVIVIRKDKRSGIVDMLYENMNKLKEKSKNP